MLRACEKRPVPLAELEKATDEIEQAIQNSLDREISTEKIGELVMERLKPLDEVAYVRFARASNGSGRGAGIVCVHFTATASGGCWRP